MSYSYASIDLLRDVCNNKDELLLSWLPPPDPRFKLIYSFGFGVIFFFDTCDFPELNSNLSSDLLLDVLPGGVLNLSSFCYGVLATISAFCSSLIESLGFAGDFI